MDDPFEIAAAEAELFALSEMLGDAAGRALAGGMFAPPPALLVDDGELADELGRALREPASLAALHATIDDLRRAISRR